MKNFFQKLFNYLTYRIWLTDEELAEEAQQDIENERLNFLQQLHDTYQKELDGLDKRTKRAKYLKTHIEELKIKLNG
jgi:hypothetical protein